LTAWTTSSPFARFDAIAAVVVRKKELYPRSASRTC
jgi:hypothetical protein